MITAKCALRLAARHRLSPLAALAAGRANYASYALWKTMQPETAKTSFFEAFDNDSSLREQVVYSLAFASDSLDTDLKSDDTFPPLDDTMMRQLLHSYSTLQSPSSSTVRKMRSRLPPHLNLSNLEPFEMLDTEDALPELEEDGANITQLYKQPLPKTTTDITPSKLDHDKRAIVVTDIKQPFRIINVNTTWESLCGYKLDECKDKSLGPLLQGPDTDWGAVSALISQLFAGEEASVVLTNYTKAGRRFRNLVRVGPVKDEMGKTVNFVGVLREMKDDVESGVKYGMSRRETSRLPFVA